MNTSVKFLKVFLIGMVSAFVVVGCGSGGGNGGDDGGDGIVTPAGAAEIIFLHHSTGGIIWDGGVQQWFQQNAPQHSIVEQWFPGNVDGNYPYDYWNIWVNQAGTGDPTLETLTAQYRMIVFKHCFPVSAIEENTGVPNIASDEKRLENYYLQYNALKDRLHQFSNIFLVWTGAVQIQGSISAESAQRMRTFVDWVKNVWDEPGDNIYIFDFYALETEGGLYLRNGYAADEGHPTDAFAQMVAPWFSQRIVNVLNGNGDSTSLTGQ
jgi:hypothetical protein